MLVTQRTTMIAALGMSIVLGLPAFAQKTDSSKSPSAASTGPSLGHEAPVDESALRYFASQGDMRRAQAEIARLKALYPYWTPPSDLSKLASGTPVRDPQLDRLWVLYSEGKIAEMRAAIADRQASDPQWQAPAELLAVLDAAEARRRLVNASDIGQWQTVLSMATDNPSLLTCADVDALWRVAEAFAKTGRMDRAQDVYAYILTNCAKPAERLGTLQKAAALLSEQQVDVLLKLERKGGDNPDDFSIVRDDLARRRVQRVATDSEQIAASDDLAAVERSAKKASDPGDALLLGWYNYHHKESEKALRWFKTALERNGGAKAAEGYALSLRALERFVEAEAFAYEWHDKAPENLKVYLDVATALLSQDPPLRLPASVVARAVPPISRQRFADGAQALGWYAYNTGQYKTALEWFRTALKWKTDDEPSAYGFALASQRLDERGDFSAIVASWRKRSARIAELADRDSHRTAAGQEPGKTQAREIDCTTTGTPKTLPPDDALERGWCLMEINRPLEAITAFDHAARNGSDRIREEAAYGKALAYLRKDLTAKAAKAADEADQTPQRRAELNATILAQRTLTAYRNGRYQEALRTLDERARITPEPTDLMLIRGWSHLKLGNYRDAEKAFRAVLKAGPSEPAEIGLNAIQETLHPSRG